LENGITAWYGKPAENAKRNPNPENYMSDNNLCTDPLMALMQCRRYAELIAFNRQPSRYMHFSWRAEFIDTSLSASLFDTGYAHVMLSDHICKETGITDIPVCAITHPAVRIGMSLDAEQLRKLACGLGAILIGLQIRQAISKASVAAWIRVLGEPLHRFTCKQAPLLGGAQFVGFAESGAPSLQVETVIEQFAETGFRFLNAYSHKLDNAIGQRLRLKLPREHSQPALHHSSQIHQINQNHHTRETWTWIHRIWNCMPTHALQSRIPDPAGSR
jgi:hypothetical protein